MWHVDWPRGRQKRGGRPYWLLTNASATHVQQKILKRSQKNLEVLQNPKNMCGMLTDRERGKKEKEDHTDNWPMPVPSTAISNRSHKEPYNWHIWYIWHYQKRIFGCFFTTTRKDGWLLGGSNGLSGFWDIVVNNGFIVIMVVNIRDVKTLLETLSSEYYSTLA